MSSGRILSRCDLVHVPTPMIGQSVHSFTQGRMLEEGILGNSITVVFLPLIFARGYVGVEICVNMLMVFLNAGYTLLNIEPSCARMVLVVQEGSASLLILLRNSDLLSMLSNG
ncbi:hypothetical protein REPUB_Repub01dG0122200 [Reevesia pubescens]